MAIVNDKTQETFLKFLYVGAAGCGKSTNLQWLFKQTSTDLPSKHFDLSQFAKNKSDFEFLPVALGGQQSLKINLFTLPAHNLWETIPQHLMLGVDGIVFVVDTRLSKLYDNESQFDRIEALANLTGRTLDNIPLVFQYNHRDAIDAVPIHALKDVYSRKNTLGVEAVATKGIGIIETLESLTEIVLQGVEQHQQSSH